MVLAGKINPIDVTRLKVCEVHRLSHVSRRTLPDAETISVCMENEAEVARTVVTRVGESKG